MVSGAMRCLNARPTQSCLDTSQNEMEAYLVIAIMDGTVLRDEQHFIRAKQFVLNPRLFFLAERKSFFFLGIVKSSQHSPQPRPKRPDGKLDPAYASRLLEFLESGKRPA